MPHLEPHEALVTGERALRELVAAVLSRRDGVDWLERSFSLERVMKWRERRDVEANKREVRGHAHVSDRELDYAEVYELRDIVKKRWNDGFAQALRTDRREVEVLLDRFETLRNSVAHSRDLLPFERDLLSGIAGEIRNRVTIYLSAQDPSGEYYPRVEQVADSFGNVIRNPVDAVASTDTGIVLHPGEAVHYACVGTDPQGRELLWYLRTQGERRTEPVVYGAEARLEWAVAERDVAERRAVEVCMRSAGSAYHRLGSDNDDAHMVFVYRVDPPT